MTTSTSHQLLPLDFAASRLGALNRHYVGVKAIPVSAVIGTLDRSQSDFDRRFAPLKPQLRARLQSLRRKFPNGDFPPIQVIELGGAYFVIDGHHRIALARDLSMEFVDAEITSVTSDYVIPSDVDAVTLVHTDAHRRFYRDSGLVGMADPATIQFSRPQGYPELLELIQAWGYARSLEAGTLLPPQVVARRWLDEVFRPGVAAVREAELPVAYGYKTEADLFLWVHQLLRAMMLDRSETVYLDAARQARRQRVSRRFRRRFQREKSAPLARKR